MGLPRSVHGPTEPTTEKYFGMAPRQARGSIVPDCAGQVFNSLQAREDDGAASREELEEWSRPNSE